MDGRKVLWVAPAASLTCLGCTTEWNNRTQRTDTAPSSLAQLASGKDSSRSREARVGYELAKLKESQANSPKIKANEREQMLDQARQAYQQVLKLTPDHTEASIGLARVYSALNDHEHAIATYHEALKKNPKEGGLWYALCMCHAQKKDFPQAIDCCKKARELDPENRTYAGTLGWMLARNGQVPESFALMSRLYGEPQAHYKMAQMMVHLKQTDQSREQLRLALRKNPDFAPAQEMLAQLDRRGASPADTGGRPLPGRDGNRGTSPVATVSFQYPEPAADLPSRP